jgi:hypothetical protein
MRYDTGSLGLSASHRAMASSTARSPHSFLSLPMMLRPLGPGPVIASPRSHSSFTGSLGAMAPAPIGAEGGVGVIGGCGGKQGEGRFLASSRRTSGNVTVFGCAVPEFLALWLATRCLVRSRRRSQVTHVMPVTLRVTLPALHSSTPSALHASRMALITVPRMSSAADQISMSNSAVPPTSSRAERTAKTSATRRTPARRAMARFAGSDARIIRSDRALEPAAMPRLVLQQEDADASATGSARSDPAPICRAGRATMPAH